MNNSRFFIGVIFILGIIFLVPDSLIAQEKETSKKPAPKEEKTAFVDRDGDGIHDGMEHRFRRGKKRRNKRHRNRNRADRHQTQGGGTQNQSPKGQ